MYKDIGQREGCSWVLEKSMRIYLLRESNYWSKNADTGTRKRKTELYRRGKTSINVLMLCY